MSFGRRLALFFVLIAIVPTLALVGMLVIVSEDSRRGKADARLAAGLETALALYETQIADARSVASDLVKSPELASGIRRLNNAQLEQFAAAAVKGPEVAGVQVLGQGGEVLASAGEPKSIAFAETRLSEDGQPSGTLRVSTTTADEYGSEVRRLTKRELIVSREGAVLTATVTPPGSPVEPGETRDLALREGEFRAHMLSLDSTEDESLLLLGPRKEGSVLTIDRPVAVLLVGFLLLGIVFAYALARTLTGLHAQVAEQAVTDPLTGLGNRRRLHQLLVAEVERAQRFGHKLSVLIIDVDDFKRINDQSGHPQGDTVLRTISEIVRRGTRTIDIAARYGGDELALLLLETNAAGALKLAERLRSEIATARIPLRDGAPTRVTVSIGVATMPDSAVDDGELIEAADQALLRAKRKGKDQVEAAPKLSPVPARGGG